jgi:hypothetical protein
MIDEDAQEFYARLQKIADRFTGSIINSTTVGAFRMAVEAEVHQWYSEGGSFRDLHGDRIATFEEAELHVSQSGHSLNASLVRKS